MPTGEPKPEPKSSFQTGLGQVSLVDALEEPQGALWVSAYSPPGGESGGLPGPGETHMTCLLRPEPGRGRESFWKGGGDVEDPATPSPILCHP